MSYKITNRVWDIAPEHITGTTLVILLSLADQANDNGICWPGRQRLAKRAGIKKVATISAHLSRLRECGAIYTEQRNNEETLRFVVCLGMTKDEIETALLERESARNYFFPNAAQNTAQIAYDILELQSKVWGGWPPNADYPSPQMRTTLVPKCGPKSSFNHQRTITLSDSSESVSSLDESESEQVPKPLSLQEEKTQPVEQSHLSQEDEASAAPPPAKKSKAKILPKRTRADQDAALEVLMMIGLSGTRNVSLAAKLLKSLDTVVAATFNLDPAAAAAIVSASNLTAFYQWYDTENNDFNRPTGHTLPNWFIQWYRATQSHPATQTRIGSITIPAAINTPTVGYRFCDHDNIYYHHSIINLVVDHYENGIPYTIPNTITIEKD